MQADKQIEWNVCDFEISMKIMDKIARRCLLFLIFYSKKKKIKKLSRGKNRHNNILEEIEKYLKYVWRFPIMLLLVYIWLEGSSNK